MVSLLIYFSVLELFSKILGIFILGFIARSLDLHSFAEYSFSLLLFGILFDFSNFAYQEKHLCEYNLSSSYLYSNLYLLRQKLVLFLSVCCFLLFVLIDYFYFTVNILPLSIIFLIAVFNIEFVFYGVAKPYYIIFSRFVSQLILLSAIFICFYNESVSSDNVMYFQLLNSLTLCFLILYLSVNDKL